MKIYCIYNKIYITDEGKKAAILDFQTKPAENCLHLTSLTLPFHTSFIVAQKMTEQCFDLYELLQY